MVLIFRNTKHIQYVIFLFEVFKFLHGLMQVGVDRDQDGGE